MVTGELRLCPGKLIAVIAIKRRPRHLDITGEIN